MMKQGLLLVVAAAFSLVTYADEGEHHVLVDVEEVVAAGRVEPVGGISAAGQPDEAALQVFADSGYEVVIDMRAPDEDRGTADWAGTVESKGMRYIAFPIDSEDDISFEGARKLDELLQGIDGPVLLHCASGNRVGAILALRESLKGADDEEALRYGRDAGMTRLEPLVREVLQSD